MIEVASLFAQTSRCCVPLSAVLCDPTVQLLCAIERRVSAEKQPVLELVGGTLCWLGL